MKQDDFVDALIGVAVVLTGGLLLIGIIVAVVNHFS